MKQHFSKQRNRRKTHLDVHVRIWSMGLGVLKKPLLIILIKCWIIFLAMKSEKRRSIGRRRHVGAKKRWIWNWVSPKMGVWQKCSRTQGSKKILREMSEERLRSLEKIFFLGEEMVRWRRKFKVKIKVNSANGGRKSGGRESKKKKKRDKESGGPKFCPYT